VIFLIIFGCKFHIIEEIGSAEMDGYVGKAEQIAAGNLPIDPYRPLLYPILSAGMGALLGDSFGGARTLSSLFAGLFVLTGYFLGKHCFDRRVGFFVLAALICNFNVITMGISTSTDIMFSALALVTLYLAVSIKEGSGIRDIAFLALASSIAYFTRYVAVFVLPVVIFSLISRRGPSTRRKVVDILLYCVLSVIFLLPHFFLSVKQS
jgi:4-amino-4-deoxy-L-arabinose transferase-like glycosyltransferase